MNWTLPTYEPDYSQRFRPKNRITVRDFGPIRDSGVIEIKKVTVFLGNQGSGKSTLAKLISTFLWMEKALVRGDYQKKWFERKGRFRSQFLRYHRLENYIPKNSDIGHVEYRGDFFRFSFAGGSLSITSITEKGEAPYILPQITYIPAERNLAAYMKNATRLKDASGAFITFLGDFDAAKQSMRGKEVLPVGNVTIEYDKLNDRLKLEGKGYGNRYKVFLHEAASGFQSMAPLYLVSQHFSSAVRFNNDNVTSEMSSDDIRRFKKSVSDIYDNTELTDEQRRFAVSALSRRFKKSAFINIVEEPEQNLFPSSQGKLLHHLLTFNNERPGNKLVITTHSPYLVNALTLAVQGAELRRTINQARTDLLDRLNAVVPMEAVTPASDVAVYQFDESNGTVKPLPMPHGIPSDANYLNEALGESNDAFGRLLDIEEELG